MNRVGRIGFRSVPATIVFATVIVASGCGGGGSGSSGNGSGENNEPLDLTNFQDASIVIGQADFTSNDPGTSAENMRLPNYTPEVFDGNLYIVDGDNYRVLGYNGIPQVNGATADFAIGQDNFVSMKDNDPLSQPSGVKFYDGIMIVTDGVNTIFTVENPPTDQGAASSFDPGDDETYGDQGCTRESLSEPSGVDITPDGKLIVADPRNHRVLIWDEISVPLSEPDMVLGQVDFENCDANRGDGPNPAQSVPEAGTLNSPRGVWSDGERLAVYDSANSRVLLWQAFPTENGADADNVLGQDAMDTRESGSGASGLDAPTGGRAALGLDFNSHQLAVPDNENHRVLIWEGFPDENGVPADLVLGQENFDDNDENAGEDNPGQETMRFPAGARFIGNRLLVTDTANNRVLVFEGN